MEITTTGDELVHAKEIAGIRLPVLMMHPERTLPEEWKTHKDGPACMVARDVHEQMCALGKQPGYIIPTITDSELYVRVQKLVIIMFILKYHRDTEAGKHLEKQVDAEYHRKNPHIIKKEPNRWPRFYTNPTVPKPGELPRISRESYLYVLYMLFAFFSMYYSLYKNIMYGTYFDAGMLTLILMIIEDMFD